RITAGIREPAAVASSGPGIGITRDRGFEEETGLKSVLRSTATGPGTPVLKSAPPFDSEETRMPGAGAATAAIIEESSAVTNRVAQRGQVTSTPTGTGLALLSVA